MTSAPASAPAPSAELALRTINLSVGYRSRRAPRVVLTDLNVCVRPGELVCLIGPNGIGKSTLLRTLAKMQPVMAGSIELRGRALSQLKQIDLARHLGVVLTERLTVGALTARQVVELGRYPHSGWLGGLCSRDRQVVHWAINAVGAQHLANQDYGTLSDGERQRIMIARALAQEPLLLLLDEPTAFLDVPSRVELMGLLRKLVRDECLAVVVSTHDLDLALRTGDTVWLIMPDGRLHSGAPEDLVAAGDVGRAFRGDSIHFRPEERTFRLLPGRRGPAAVYGAGLPAILISAVLEREDYAITLDGKHALTVAPNAGGTGWEVSLGGDVFRGDSFAALAECLRSLPSATTPARKVS